MLTGDIYDEYDTLQCLMDADCLSETFVPTSLFICCDMMSMNVPMLMCSVIAVDLISI